MDYALIYITGCLLVFLVLKIGARLSTNSRKLTLREMIFLSLLSWVFFVVMFIYLKFEN